MLNHQVFFDHVRHQPFPGALSQSQVQGMEAILSEWDRRGLVDLRWLAYMLATTYHETAHTMQPIAEFGHGKGKKYGMPVNGKVYYGRGYVQLTWDYNYKKMGDLLNVDLIGNPELALSPPIAAGIMFEGMIRGSFTGRKLGDYFNAGTDWKNARKIINGLDRAETIANYGKQFHGALIAAQMLPKPPAAAAPPVEWRRSSSTSSSYNTTSITDNAPTPQQQTSAATGILALLLASGAWILATVEQHPAIVVVGVLVLGLAIATWLHRHKRT